MCSCCSACSRTSTCPPARRWCTLRAQARDLYYEFGLDASFSWRADEGTVTGAAARLASFGAVSGNDMLTGGCVINPLGRWAAGRLRTMLAGPGEDLSAAELSPTWLSAPRTTGSSTHGTGSTRARPRRRRAAVLVAALDGAPAAWIATYAVELLVRTPCPCGGIWGSPHLAHARFALYEMEAGPEPASRNGCGSRSSQLPGRSLERAGRSDHRALGLPSRAAVAADDLDHRVAVARASDHPSAGPLVRP